MSRLGFALGMRSPVMGRLDTSPSGPDALQWNSVE